MTHVVDIDSNLSREKIYPLLKSQAEALVKDEPDLIANMANLAALLKEALGFHWVGFYRVEGEDLVLGPFQGPVACTRIKIPNGVCGACVQQKKAILVPDVDKFEGHIACSSLSKSELVIPLIVEEEVLLILDIDSSQLDDFSDLDLDNLTCILKFLSNK